jgi:hypothetical protein
MLAKIKDDFLSRRVSRLLLLLSIVQYGYRFFQLRREPPEERRSQEEGTR